MVRRRGSSETISASVRSNTSVSRTTGESGRILVIQSLPEIFYGYHKARAGARRKARDHILFAAPDRHLAGYDEIGAQRLRDRKPADPVVGYAFVPELCDDGRGQSLAHVEVAAAGGAGRCDHAFVAPPLQLALRDSGSLAKLGGAHQ